MNNTISGQLENAGEAIEERFDNDFEDIQALIQEVRHLRMHAQKNSERIERQMKQIEHLERLVNPVPPPLNIARNISTDTVDYSGYKPQHPYFQNAAAQSAARKAYCWLTQSSDDKKNKAKQDKLVQEYYGDKTTDARREAIIKELMAMARCKDKCKLQGKTLVSSKGCGDDDAVREFVMKRLESSEFHDKKTGKKAVLTRRRAKTMLMEESSAMSFRA
jgi:hypothetical protein